MHYEISKGEEGGEGEARDMENKMRGSKETELKMTQGTDIIPHFA